MALKTVIMLPIAVIVRITNPNLVAPSVTTLLIFVASGFIPIEISLVVILMQLEDRRLTGSHGIEVETKAI